jgi:hypothetical protein
MHARLHGSWCRAAPSSTYAKAAGEQAGVVVQDITASVVTTLKGSVMALQARGIRTPRGNVVGRPPRFRGSCPKAPVGFPLLKLQGLATLERRFKYGEAR